MQPIRIELEGFTAFRERACLDFSNLDLFAITGPTGAGKSSLIDAVAYALYGRIPRVGANVGACISQGCPRMWVQLDFQAGEGTFRIFRETRRTGQGTIRLERCHVGDLWEPIVSGARAVGEQVQKLVGLDFDGFSRSVLLPQGQFQEFLAGDPEKRRDVLSGLLHLDLYDGVRRRAREAERDLHTRIEATEQHLRDDYAEATPETMLRVQTELETLQIQDQALQERIDQLASASDLARAITRVRGELTESRRRQAEIQTKREEAQALVDHGDEQVQRLLSSLDGLQAKIAANAFHPDRLSMLTLAAGLCDQLEQAGRESKTAADTITESERTVAGSHREAEQAAAVLDACRSALEVAQERMQTALTDHAAAAVQQSLSVGDACPVCGATVGVLPHIECADLDEAQSAHDRAQREEQAAQDAAAEAHTRCEVAVTKLDQAQTKVQELEARRARLTHELAEALPDDVDRSGPTIKPALQQQQAAQKERAQLETQERDTRAQMERLQSDLAAARAQLDALRGQTEALTEAASRTEHEVKSSLTALHTAADRTEWGKQLAGVDAGEPLERAIAGLLDQARQGHADAQKRSGQIEQQLKDLQDKIARKNELEAELNDLRPRHNVAADLAFVLQANHFGAFVQSEALCVLAEDGSQRLKELSEGRYQLQVSEAGQDFEIIDRWNGDEARSVRTLSGGETFLASLALALTMAESLPGLAPGQRVALDSIFIDEGFGALDPEALDRAAGALDALRANRRMVCVVTHLEELAERMPAQVRIIKSESGSRIDLQG